MEQGLALLSILLLAPLAPEAEPEVAALSAHHARQALAL